MPSSAILYYVHDPMCSWCWGFKPCWDELQRQLSKALPNQLRIEPLVGGLAPDTESIMPVEQQTTITSTWHTIAQQLGTEFNFDFWAKNTPRRSTYMSCRAVLAAENQVQGGGNKMLLLIQEAYYLRALNPSDTDTLAQLAVDMGLDAQAFREALSSRALQVSLRDTFRLVRRLPIQGFPSLVLVRRASTDQRPVPVTPADTLQSMDAEELLTDFISVDYSNPKPMFEQIKALCAQNDVV